MKSPGYYLARRIIPTYEGKIRKILDEVELEEEHTERVISKLVDWQMKETTFFYDILIVGLVVFSLLSLSTEAII